MHLTRLGRGLKALAMPDCRPAAQRQVEQVLSRLNTASPWAVMRLSVEPDPKIQVRNDLQFVSEIDAPAVLDALLDRVQAAQDMVKAAYPKPEDSETSPRRKPAAAKKGARRY